MGIGSPISQMEKYRLSKVKESKRSADSTPDLLTPGAVFSHHSPMLLLPGKKLTLTPEGPNLLLTVAGYRPLKAPANQNRVISALYLNHLWDSMGSHGCD